MEQMASPDRVSVPRAQLEEWARLVATLAADAHLGHIPRSRAAATAEQIRYWSTQRTDVGEVRVSQRMGDVGQGSTVVGYVGPR